MTKKINTDSLHNEAKPSVILDPSELLGFSRYADLSGENKICNTKELGSLANKIGEPPPPAPMKTTGD